MPMDLPTGYFKICLKLQNQGLCLWENMARQTAVNEDDHIFLCFANNSAANLQETK